MNLHEQEPQPTTSEYRTISLTKGQICKVSPQDFDSLNRWRWSARWSKEANSFYAARRSYAGGEKKTVLMAREILQASSGNHVDHRDRDSLNNTRENLRECSPSQNAFNRKKRSDSKWLYKGTSLVKGRWRAEIQAFGARLFLGLFDTQEQSRDAYLDASKEVHGEFSCDGALPVIAPCTAAASPRAKRGRSGPLQARESLSQPDDQSVKLIPLTQGQVAVIDSEDYDEISRYFWHAIWSPISLSYYAKRCEYDPSTGKKKGIYIHREVMNAPVGSYVDHIFHDTLDCRKKNLRLATFSQNMANRAIRRDSKMPYKGISKTSTGLWIAQVSSEKRVYRLGKFSTPEAAHAAYVKAAKELHGKFYCAG
jgi:hypothetical protein